MTSLKRDWEWESLKQGLGSRVDGLGVWFVGFQADGLKGYGFWFRS